MIPVFCAIILAVGLMNHVLVIPPLLQVAKRDAWLVTIIIIPPLLLWICLIYYMMKRMNQASLLTWLNRYYGQWTAWAIRAFFILYLFSIAAITIKETTVWTKVSYLTRTPISVLVLTLLIVCFFAARWGIKTITIASGILLPFVIVFGDFVMSANLPKKDYSLLLPVLENGWMPIWRGTIFIGSGLAELITILLLQHTLHTRMRLWWMMILALFLVLLVLGPVTGAIAEFGPYEAADLRYPAYEEWRLVSIGKFIQHVDFLSIYQWLSGAVIRISIAIYLLVDLIPVRTNKARMLWLISVFALLFIISILPISDIMYLDFLRTVYFPVSLCAVLILTIILFFLAFFAKQRTKPSKESAKR